MHMLAGLKKGDSISISRESLPGAVLFPGIKYKEPKVRTEDPASVLTSEVPNGGSESDQANSGSDTVDPVKEAEGDSGSQTLAPANSDSPQRPIIPQVQSPTQVHRFLVVTRERFIVLDSGGSGIGSTATVKSNHHLTEVRQLSHLFPSLPLGDTLGMSWKRIATRDVVNDASALITSPSYSHSFCLFLVLFHVSVA